MRQRRIGRLVPLAAALAGLYAFVLRPWLLCWGSTAEERRRALPGDELVPDPTYTTTRAVTIDAPPRDVWPWLAQMGQDRAGFYTHNWVERLLLSGITDVHELHPEWEELKVGDLVRTYRALRPGQPLGWPVTAVEPGRALVLTSTSLPAGTYAFALEAVDGRVTRLLCRDRTVPRWWEWPFMLLVYEPLHAYMQTGLLQGIKQRAERPVKAPVTG